MALKCMNSLSCWLKNITSVRLFRGLDTLMNLKLVTAFIYTGSVGHSQKKAWY